MDLLNSPLLTPIMIALSIFISGSLTYRSYTRYSKVSETDIIMKLNDRIYDSKRGKKIIEMIKDPNKAIVDLEHKDGKEGVVLPHRDVENFLNDVEMLFTLRQNKLVTKSMFQQAFSWVIDLIVKNKSVMEFIDAKQVEYGGVAWKPISDYHIKHKERNFSS